jgi:two-component system, OmpR family, response regulator MprA
MKETVNSPIRGQEADRNMEKAVALPLLSTYDTVLIVEDSDVVRRLIVDFLGQKYPGLLIETASDGFEALDRISARTPSILITDIVMSGMDGIALLKALCERGISLPTLAMSGYWSRETLKERLAEEGITSSKPILFLEKPFQIERLSSLMEKFRETELKE